MRVDWMREVLCHRGQDVSADCNRLIARQTRGFQLEGTACANALRHEGAWDVHITVSLSISCSAGHIRGILGQ
jgi:hypothetical protein